MAYEEINIGAGANDHTGDPVRTFMGKVKRMLADLYSKVVDITAIETMVGTAVEGAVSDLGDLAKAVKGKYETVAASQTAQPLGATGATGDFVSHITVVPESTSPGNVILLDNAIAITVFAGGTGSVLDLKPFVVPLQMYSTSGAWKLTTGANVSVVAVGDFT